VNDSEWWQKEMRQRPNPDGRILLGNSVRLDLPEKESETLFEINTIKNFIECVRTLAHRVKSKKRTYVAFLSEEQYNKTRPEETE
jgi:hypothetical protein